MKPVYNITFFEPELSLIVDPNIRRQTKTALEEAPAYIWYAPSSVTGKYHPPEDNDPGGICLHLKKTSWVAYRIFDNMGYNTDIGISAGLTHDIALRGLGDEPSEEYADYEQHGELAYEKLHSYIYKLAMESDRVIIDWNTICNCVRCHMGRWGKEKPTSPEEIALHCADVAASTRGLVGLQFIKDRLGYHDESPLVALHHGDIFPPDMSIEEIVSRKQFFITDEDDLRVFNFGQYKGEYLQRTAEDHPKYLRWMLSLGIKSIDNEKGFPLYVINEILEEMERTKNRLHAIGLLDKIHRETYGIEGEE